MIMKSRCGHTCSASQTTEHSGGASQLSEWKLAVDGGGGAVYKVKQSMCGSAVPMVTGVRINNAMGAHQAGGRQPSGCKGVADLLRGKCTCMFCANRAPGGVAWPNPADYRWLVSPHCMHVRTCPGRARHGNVSQSRRPCNTLADAVLLTSKLGPKICFVPHQGCEAFRRPRIRHLDGKKG